MSDGESLRMTKKWRRRGGVAFYILRRGEGGGYRENVVIETIFGENVCP